MSVGSQVEAILSALCQAGTIRKEDYELSFDYPLSHLTTFRTGGPATVLFPKTEKVICEMLSALKREKVPYFVLGNGSNTLALDEGYDGLILSLSQFKDTCVKGEEITALAGVSITNLASLAQKHALEGMEFFYGIPGSVGGAVYMNAGAYGGECKDILKEVTYWRTDGTICTEPVEKLNMGYRTSRFENGEDVILSATFRLRRGEPAAIRTKMDELMAKRMEKQPLEYPSAGSTFKRCEGRFTAQMIDEAGLKGLRVGGAMVSEKHAGFVINYDHATSADILELIRRIQEIILEKEGLSIRCEVRFIQ